MTIKVGADGYIERWSMAFLSPRQYPIQKPSAGLSEAKAVRSIECFHNQIQPYASVPSCIVTRKNGSYYIWCSESNTIEAEDGNKCN